LEEEKRRKKVFVKKMEPRLSITEISRKKFQITKEPTPRREEPCEAKKGNALEYRVNL